jgi:ParB-like chromosome segregation protein Spo0J
MNALEQNIDLHRLDFRFSGTRLIDRRRVERLANSMDGSGQIIPCTVVSRSDAEPLVLVDGYHRVAALRRLGRDTVKVETWTCDVNEALLKVLACTNARNFQALEEALLLRELQSTGPELSQRDLARRCGRDVSWVCRRLQLLVGLTDELRTSIDAGTLSVWAATRILGPLARANAAHADKLMKVLRATPLSTRELQLWFEHYQKSIRSVRESMVDKPHLFLEALRENEQQLRSESLHAGPEGECTADMQILKKVLARLKKRVATLRPLPPCLWTDVPHLRASFEDLSHELERSGAHDAA